MNKDNSGGNLVPTFGNDFGPALQVRQPKRKHNRKKSKRDPRRKGKGKG